MVDENAQLRADLESRVVSQAADLRAAEAEIDRLTALVDSLRATIAEHERVERVLSFERKEAIADRDRAATSAESRIDNLREVVEVAERAADDYRGTIANLRLDLGTAHHSLGTLAVILLRLRTLTGATADGDVAMLVKQLRARAEGRADVRVVESEVEGMARRIVERAVGAHLWTEIPSSDGIRILSETAWLTAAQHLADRDARRKAGGVA